MRRCALFSLFLLMGACVSGCTGTGVFLDHTTKWFEARPNSPAGSSETFLRLRGEKVDVPPLLPEQGNVWPTDYGPDKTMQELSQQSPDATRGSPGQAPGAARGPGGRANPAVNRANESDRGLPPPQVPPPPPSGLRSPAVNTPNGPAVDVTGGKSERGYRQLQSPGAGGTGILVPNGNGTSTLIGPDGSIQTVPTRQ